MMVKLDIFKKPVANALTYFENLTVKLHVLSAFNTHVKFYVNQILFTRWFINLYFVYNFKL